MPIRQTVSLPTYAEVKADALRQWLHNGSDFGIAVFAGFQQVGAKQLPYLDRRAALLSARAKFAVLRERRRQGITVPRKA